MSKGIRLSINQLATFNSASEAKKKRIILQQKNPNPIIVSWYGSAKSTMRKFYQDPTKVEVIEKGLQSLKESRPATKWHASNRNGSIEILERFLKMTVPKCFEEGSVTFVKPAQKSFNIRGVEVIASPDLMFFSEDNGIRRYGAVKFHTSKSGKFNSSQSQIVATALKMYLKDYIAQFDKDAEVANDFCLCVDVFNSTITQARNNSSKVEDSIKETCSEVVQLWDKAA